MSKSNTELLASAVQSASGNSASFPIRTQTMAVVGIDITATSGTSEALDIWLQVSDDGGDTWYDFIYSQQMTSDDAAADINAAATNRNINGVSSALDVGKHLAIYRHLPAGHVRLKWVISGTTPTFTFSASLAGA